MTSTTATTTTTTTITTTTTASTSTKTRIVATEITIVTSSAAIQRLVTYLAIESCADSKTLVVL